MRLAPAGTVARDLVVAIVVVAATTMTAKSAAGQTQRGAVRGVVRDSAGHALAAVQLNVIGTDIRASSDTSGAYRLAGVWPGTVAVSARRLGFAPETATVVVAAASTVARDFTLSSTAVTLEAEAVNADPTRGKMAAFNQRRSRGVGSFITRDEIEKRQPASLSELLRYLPGVHVTQKMAGEPQPVQMQRSAATTAAGACVVRLYVDGHPYENGNLDDFNPSAVEGVEVYRSAAEIPADFRTRDATCGLISVWTRDPESARRRP